jgi:hypothetical protein
MADDSGFGSRVKELLRVLVYVIGGIVALSPAIGLGYLLWYWTGDGLKYIAGFTAAFAVLLGAAFIGYPLVKLARVFGGLEESVHQLTEQTLPVIGELEGTVQGANTELGKLALVTEDVAGMSGHIKDTTGSIARTTRLVSDTVVVPFIKLKALGIAAKRALKPKEG